MTRSTLMVMGITHCSTVDGPGLRTVVWFQGCKNHCKGCHNPESWETYDQLGAENTSDPRYKFIRNYDHSALYTECQPNKLEDGLTLSGGDPLWQNNLLELAYFIRMYHHFHPQKNIWMYTGLKYGNLKNHIRKWVIDKTHVDTSDPIDNENVLEYTKWLYDFLFEYVDVLVDGPFIEDLKTDKCIYRGSSNQRLINMKESVKQNKLTLFDPDTIRV